MKTLALFGGNPEIPKEYRLFDHPKFSSEVLSLLNTSEEYRKAAISYDGNGNLIEQLESALESLFSLEYVLCTNSGTSALFSMYQSLGLGDGDEVLVPVYTYFATATPLIQLGCKVKFVDADDNGNISSKILQKSVSSSTKAIVITHMWGIPCDMIEIENTIKGLNLPLLEDASHAHGALYLNRPVGGFGKCAAWSLGAQKLLSGGQGGCLGTNDRTLYEKAVVLGHFHRKVKDSRKSILSEELVPYEISGTGLNFKMHPQSAIFLLEQIKNFSEQLEHRREVAKYLRQELSEIDGFELPRIPEQANPSWYAFPILYNESAFDSVPKERFVAAVNAEGCDIDIPGSTRPLFDYKVFGSSLSNTFSPQDFPGAYNYHKRIFKMPTWYGTNRMEYARHYVNAIKKVIENMSQIRE
jgi:perosamine synthetase